MHFKFIIPQGVSIGASAFWGSTGLTSISLPQGVSIGDSAFRDCTGLTSISIPEGVTSISVNAFYGCSSLTSISIPEGVTSIGDGAFYGCSRLSSISIPESVTSISVNAFDSCTGLKTISIPQGVTSISNSAFSNCTSLTSISLPQGIASIGYNAFSGCTSLTSISLPQEITSIGDYAFINCKGLTTISIPQGVSRIGVCTFSGCTSLTSISLLQGVKSIAEMAFDGCNALKTISIPKGVSSIGDLAFRDCTGLTSIRFYFAPTIIYNSTGTIPDTTLIIGYDPSSAKTYAANFYRPFEVIVIVTGVSLNKNATTLNVGGYETLAATITPDNVIDKSVTWSVSSQSGSNIATISNTGVVTAVNPGTAVIRATSNDDTTKYAECSVSVTTIDKTILASAIMDASTLLASTPIGTAANQVSQGAHDAYNSAIANATTVKDNTSVTQAQIDSAVTTLAAATTAFYNAINPAAPVTAKYSSHVELGTSPDSKNEAGLFIGLNNLQDSTGTSLADIGITGYSIEVDFDPAKVGIFGVTNMVHIPNFCIGLDIVGQKATINFTGNLTGDFNRLLFVPLTLSGSTDDITTLTIRFLSIGASSLEIPDSITLSFQRGKILNDGTTNITIGDAVAGYITNE